MIPSRFRAPLASWLALATAVPALAAAEGSEASWTLTSSVTSQYLFRGVRVGGESFQPSLDYSAGAFAAGLWSSVGLTDHVSGDSDPEFDFYASYTFANAADTWSVVPGFSLYAYPDAERANGLYPATFEPSLAVNYTTPIGVRFTPKFYYDVTLKGPTAEITAAFALPLKQLGTELGFSATAGSFKWEAVTRDASPAEKNWGDYWFATVTLPVQVSIRSQLALGVTYSEGRNNFYKQGTDPKVSNEDAVERWAVSLSWAVTF